MEYRPQSLIMSNISTEYKGTIKRVIDYKLDWVVFLIQIIQYKYTDRSKDKD